MDCKYFGICGGCTNYKIDYAQQAMLKLKSIQEQFQAEFQGDIEMHQSLSSHYRARAEFKIWHDGKDISYAMHQAQNKGYVSIDDCPLVVIPIYDLMKRLLKEIVRHDIKEKLFGVDFLSSSSGDMVISMLYHRQLDDVWQEKARSMAKDLQINIIGRSKKQKIIIGLDYIIEHLHVNRRLYRYMQIENSFTQPNPRVNEKMIEWAVAQAKTISGDLLELYCGAGNFTIPFATVFDKILATEISKASISAAKENMRLNNVENISFLRMSSQELVQALDGKRVFRRLQEIDINKFSIQTVFVDPPRAGLDDETIKFISRYKNIIYISCNPVTLKRDLQILCKRYKVISMAMFDQFAYTNHIEMGVRLKLLPEI